jgi:hypothetical protein
MMDEKKRVLPLWRKIVLGMGQKAGKCKEALEIGMFGSLSGTDVVAHVGVRFLETYPSRSGRAAPTPLLPRRGVRGGRGGCLFMCEGPRVGAIRARSAGTPSLAS